MIKTIKTMSKQEKERYTVPRKVQDVIPVRRIWPRTRNPCSSPIRSCSIPWIPVR